MPKRTAIGVCLALALVVAALAAAGAQARGHTAATVYEAFSYHGLVVPHTTSASGYCFTSSDVTRRDDAWRCLVGNELFDPCFSSSLAFGIVVCPVPWTDSGTEINLSRPLPSPSSHTPPSLSLEPWAVETADGDYCTLSSGASRVIHGQRLNYFCAGEPKQGLWGFPSRKTQPWTILTAPPTAHKLKTRIAIVRAWM
jgi:hypothetical protein